MPEANFVKEGNQEILISVCMIARDEEEYISKSIGSVIKYVDEVILFDTGSKDRTAEIAKQMGARVFHGNWEEDFSIARNESIRHAKGEWILVLDADEEIDAESGTQLRKLVRNRGVDAFEVTVKSELPESDAVKYDEVVLTRLFRNRPDYRYELSVHEQIRPSIERSGGVIEKSSVVITHHGYSRTNVQGERSRIERNISLLQKALVKDPNNPYFLYQLGSTYKYAGENKKALDALLRAESEDRGRLSLSIREKLYVKLGQINLDGKNYIDAVRLAEKALEINPLNDIAMLVAAVSLLFMNKGAEAYRYLQRIQKLTVRSLRDDSILEKLISVCRSLDFSG